MNNATGILSRKVPLCPSCGRAFEPGMTWPGANFCRGLTLLRFIEDQPGLSAWELSQASSIPYADTTHGLAKLREYRVVRAESEEREAGGVRYRYWSISNPAVRARFVETLRRVEALR
jgi:hypothetical protein